MADESPRDVHRVLDDPASGAGDGPARIVHRALACDVYAGGRRFRPSLPVEGEGRVGVGWSAERPRLKLEVVPAAAPLVRYAWPTCVRRREGRDHELRDVG